jgi:hypothetical protein
LPEVFSFSENLLQPDATGKVRKGVNGISAYDKSFFRVIRKEILAFTITRPRGSRVCASLNPAALALDELERIIQAAIVEKVEKRSSLVKELRYA